MERCVSPFAPPLPGLSLGESEMPNRWDEDDNHEFSRRDFLGSASAGGAVAANSFKDTRQTGFEPNTRPLKLSDNLFLLEDTCNVYLIRRNDRALLIDFGSGKILQHLRDL